MQVYKPLRTPSHIWSSVASSRASAQASIRPPCPCTSPSCVGRNGEAVSSPGKSCSLEWASASRTGWTLGTSQRHYLTFKLAYLTSLISRMSYAGGEIAWRLPIAVQLLFAITVIILLFGLPESPRYADSLSFRHAKSELICVQDGCSRKVGTKKPSKFSALYSTCHPPIRTSPRKWRTSNTPCASRPASRVIGRYSRKTSSRRAEGSCWLISDFL